MIKKELSNVWSILLIVLGAVFIIPGGLSLIIMHIVASLMSSSQSIPMHIFLIGLIIILVGFVCILYPKKYGIRFIVGAFTSFYLSATFFILYSTFIPAIMAGGGGCIGAEGGGAESAGLHPIQDVWLYELFLALLVVVFTSLGIILIFLYVKPYIAQKYRKTM
jgi:hypothetical protein